MQEVKVEITECDCQLFKDIINGRSKPVTWSYPDQNSVNVSLTFAGDSSYDPVDGVVVELGQEDLRDFEQIARGECAQMSWTFPDNDGLDVEITFVGGE